MADSKNPGSSRAAHFGGGISSGSQSGDGSHCARCEAMLADALDGTLSPDDQAVFDLHMNHCGPCSQMLADARRGAAWLEMLRDPRPQPPAELLERILSQTSGLAEVSGRHALAPRAGTAGLGESQLPGSILTPAPAHAVPTHPAQLGRVLSFRSRFASGFRGSGFGHIMLQPRLAMTAAMAFLSIALTMDLTGVRLQDIRLSDLTPGSLVRDFSSVNVRVQQYYEGLRVVYELESRVHDFESVSEDAPGGTQAAPVQGTSPAAPQNEAVPSDGSPDESQPGFPADLQPGSQQPSQAQPNPANGPGATPSHPRQRPPAARPAPNSGTSRREELHQDLDHDRLVAQRESHSAPAAAVRRLA